MGDGDREVIRRLRLRTAAGNANGLNSMRPLGEDEASTGNGTAGKQSSSIALKHVRQYAFLYANDERRA